MECKRIELNKIEIGNFKKNRESEIPQIKEQKRVLDNNALIKRCFFCMDVCGCIKAYFSRESPANLTKQSNNKKL